MTTLCKKRENLSKMAYSSHVLVKISEIHTAMNHARAELLVLLHVRTYFNCWISWPFTGAEGAAGIVVVP